MSRKPKKSIVPHLAINQCRAARAMLGWTMRELSEISGVSMHTLSNFETGRNVMLSANRRAVEEAFKKAGLELLWEPNARLVGVVGKAEVNKRELQPETPLSETETPAP